RGDGWGDEVAEAGMVVHAKTWLDDRVSRIAQHGLGECGRARFLSIAEAGALEEVAVRLDAERDVHPRRELRAAEQLAAELPRDVVIAVERRVVALEEEGVLVAPR